MAKFSDEEKLKAVLHYVEGHDSQKRAAHCYGVHPHVFKQWVDLYQIHGVAGLLKRYTNYTPEFKLDVLNYMNETGASPYEAAAVFNIPSRSTVNQWKRQLDTDGMDALIPTKKGRPSMKEKPKKPAPQNDSKESLQEEVERLRMENAYLKKLNALVKEKEASQRNLKRK